MTGTALRFQWFVAFLALLLLCSGAAGQSAGSRAISGNTLDPAFAAIAGAQVSLHRADGSLAAATTTDETGSFGFDKVAPGKYKVSVKAAGFKAYEREISVGSKTVPPLRIILEIVSQSETVTVSAADAAPRVSADT